MVRKTSIAALVVGLIVATSFVGAAAFTTATVERDVTVDIAADNNGIIELQDGTADAAAMSGNELVIEPDSAQNGLNVNATFTYGNTSNASGSNGFTITNRDDQTHEFFLNYSGSGSGTLEFYVENSSSDSVNFSDGDSPKSITLTPDETAYVVIIVDTKTGTTSITGTFTIRAETP